jgi:cyclopropane fatty-acyl-phospholipid synthase-like methyltransferase
MTSLRALMHLAVASPVLVALLAFASCARHAPHGHGPSHSEPDHMAHAFDDAQAHAKRFDDPARDAWQKPDEVISALGLSKGMKIADIGAGTGYFSVRLARTPEAPIVHAADIEPAMIAYMKARAEREGLPNVHPILAATDSANLPEPVDLVLVVDTYHHIGDRVAYFRRLLDSMRPNARLVIIDFRKDSPEGPPAEFRFEPDQITQELAEAGFVLAERHEFLPRQHFLVFRRAGG